MTSQTPSAELLSYYLLQLQKEKRRRALLRSLIADPLLLADRCGYTDLDSWQVEALVADDDLILCNVHRQGGKSIVAALKIVQQMLQPNRVLVIASPSARQSNLLYRVVLRMWKNLGRPIDYEIAQRTYLQLKNGSQLWSLPSNPDSVRGISAANFIVIDEASYLENEVYNAILPFTATTKGKVFCTFTPGGKRPEHWLYSLWVNDPYTKRIQVPATECKRIDPLWLEREHRRIGDFWFNQEYLNVFNDATTRVFKEEHIRAAFDESIEYDYSLFDMIG